MPRRFQLVDVFCDPPLSGNPLAVVLDSAGLDTAQMLRIARWMNLSETAFLLPPTAAEADYRVRIFTLERELPFAGHPTLGSCHAWLHAGGAPRDGGRIVQECGAGLVPIRPGDGRLAFAAPPLLREGPVDEAKVAEVASFLGIARDAIVDAQWADNGPGWVVALLESAQAVLDLEPARHYPRRIEVGVVGPHPAGGEAAFELRALFSDHHGAIREDPVTGSLNASTAQWLLKSGLARAPFVARQGRRVGHDGWIFVDQDGDGTVWVGGRTKTLVEGHSVL